MSGPTHVFYGSGQNGRPKAELTIGGEFIERPGGRSIMFDVLCEGQSVVRDMSVGAAREVVTALQAAIAKEEARASAEAEAAKAAAEAAKQTAFTLYNQRVGAVAEALHRSICEDAALEGIDLKFHHGEAAKNVLAAAGINPPAPDVEQV